MSGCWLRFGGLSYGYCSRLEVFVFLNLFLPPTLPPAPLCPPPGAERGASIWWLASGYATAAREVAHIRAILDWRAYGRRELTRISAPRLAAAPASHETKDKDAPHLSCLARSRPRNGRCRWHAKTEPFTTTVSRKSQLTGNSGDAPLHRSLSRNLRPNPGSPLYPGGGREGRGGEWGARNLSETQRGSLRQEQKQRQKT